MIASRSRVNYKMKQHCLLKRYGEIVYNGFCQKNMGLIICIGRKWVAKAFQKEGMLREGQHVLRRRLAVGERRDRAVAIEVADERSVALVAPLRPVVNANG
ncbi:hypothetical protein [Azospirillum sp. TSO22-1]|uniref:hypothetical protein n=1 Tax=Azospirillum sp. TSO22-1 TaxID=716789 RepID=UPI0011B63ADF|nr:hypothetical protein [Azospirillum sp. TSO22-1]